MTKLLSITPHPDAPVTCDMSGAPDNLADRLAEYQRLFEHALVGRESTETTTTFRFTAKPGVAEWVRDLATREAACCGFLSFEIDLEVDLELDGEAGEVVWTTSGGLGASEMAALDELFDETEVSPVSSQDIAHWIEDHGVPVVGA